MRYGIAGVVMGAMVLAGCGEDDNFIGDWRSDDTGAQYQLKKDGECRYINGEGLGTVCEWRAEDDRHVTITVSKDQNFVDMEGSLVGGQLMVSNPAGVDFFKPET